MFSAYTHIILVLIRTLFFSLLSFSSLLFDPFLLESFSRAHRNKKHLRDNQLQKAPNKQSVKRGQNTQLNFVSKSNSKSFVTRSLIQRTSNLPNVSALFFIFLNIFLYFLFYICCIFFYIIIIICFLIS